MSLYEAHKQLAWPSPEQILDPSGAGPNVFAQLAKDKLGKAIGRLQDGAGVKVGVLSASPEDQRSVMAESAKEADRASMPSTVIRAMSVRRKLLPDVPASGRS